mmetsp:Transcript_52242/g.123493  ORF Transcript_52242/g.123493 Transcript_52242/m.123493 type:complete len:85 (-) Transcript_52242:79-333(-)
MPPLSAAAALSICSGTNPGARLGSEQSTIKKPETCNPIADLMLVDDSALFSLFGCGSECTCLAMESAHDLRLIPQAFCPKSARL